VSILEFSESLGIFFLSLEKIFVPLLVEFLVLLNMSLLALLSLLLLIEDKLLVSSLVVLLSELSYSIFGHFSFDIFALLLTSLSVFLKSFAI